MSVSVVLDGRCRALRRRLGPVAWMILEEAALTAESSEDLAALWSPLSIRRVADSLGLGRDGSARGLALLVSEGVLRHGGDSRGAAGRFVAGGYFLMAPEGLAVSGVAERTVSGDPGPGGP